MTKVRIIGIAVALGILAAGYVVFMASSAHAHCDTTGGPVVTEAKSALEKGVVTPILKWVKKDYEAEIRKAFVKAVAVRSKGPEAKELADRYFLETLVRLHRAGEGEPYTGIKDEPVEPIVAMADKALADASVLEMSKELSNHMAVALGERFKKALEAKKNKDTSVEAGREFVEAYVTYMHYVEGLHTAITAASDHKHAGTAESNYSGTASRTTSQSLGASANR